MIRDLRSVSYLASLREGALLPSRARRLEMATINGSKAFGMADQIGSIEIGKLADFFIIKSIAPQLVPSWDPVSTVVHAVHGSDVDMVVIDSRIVMHHRKMLTLDEAAIISEAIERAPQVALRAGLKLGPRWPVE